MSGKECDEALERLYEFIDRELPDADLVRIGEHLNDCPPCREELEVNQKIKDIVSRCPKEAAPEQLRAKILQSIAEVREA